MVQLLVNVIYYFIAVSIKVFCIALLIICPYVSWHDDILNNTNTYISKPMAMGVFYAIAILGKLYPPHLILVIGKMINYFHSQ